MQSISAFLDITVFADFCLKKCGWQQNSGVCHVIHRVFGSPLGKV